MNAVFQLDPDTFLADEEAASAVLPQEQREELRVVISLTRGLIAKANEAAAPHNLVLSALLTIYANCAMAGDCEQRAVMALVGLAEALDLRAAAKRLEIAKLAEQHGATPMPPDGRMH